MRGTGLGPGAPDGCPLPWSSGPRRLPKRGSLAFESSVLSRFPVTLYQEQWLKLLALNEDIKVFIEENKTRLKVKE